MNEPVKNLSSGFLRSAEIFPDRPALEVGKLCLSYGALRDRATSLAATLMKNCEINDTKFIAVFAYRSVTAYAGILGVLMCGHGYVPLNRQFPVERTRKMLKHSGCRAIIVDLVSAQQLNDVLEDLDDGILIFLPESDDLEEFAHRWPNHTFFGKKDLEPPQVFDPNSVSADSPAYLLYTSGSTGDPKGVLVTHQNMNHFIKVMGDLFGFTEHDRFSQITDLTFDVSTFEMFVAWSKGACVCCPTQREIIMPSKFIQNSRLSLWYAGPSVGLRMKNMNMVKANQYPDLKYCFFAGEPLPMNLAQSWQEAAPNSMVVNLYGPTELTVTCTFHIYDSKKSVKYSEMGWVPIGQPHPELDVIIVDENLNEVPHGTAGELLVCGPQVALGYLNDSEKTAQAFVSPPKKNDIYYRTGDRVRRSSSEAPIAYLGRTDHQVQIHGYRVELGEIEAILREETKSDAVVALGWPPTSTGVEGIVAFLGITDADVEAIKEKIQTRLPNYMVPQEIHILSELPMNQNRKVDRNALLNILKRKSEVI